MADHISADSKAILQRYVEGLISNAELEEWLVAAEHDPSLSAAERDLLASIRLCVLEVSEELRPPEDILRAVTSILASSDPERRVIAYRTSSATSNQQEADKSATATPSTVRHAEIGISV